MDDCCDLKKLLTATWDSSALSRLWIGLAELCSSCAVRPVWFKSAFLTDSACFWYCFKILRALIYFFDMPEDAIGLWERCVRWCWEAPSWPALCVAICRGMFMAEESISEWESSQRRGWVLTRDWEPDESRLPDRGACFAAPAFAACVPLLELDRGVFSAFLLARLVLISSVCEPFFDSRVELRYVVRDVLATGICCGAAPLLEFRLDSVDLSCSARLYFSCWSLLSVSCMN